MTCWPWRCLLLLNFLAVAPESARPSFAFAIRRKLLVVQAVTLTIILALTSSFNISVPPPLFCWCRTMCIHIVHRQGNALPPTSILISFLFRSKQLQNLIKKKNTWVSCLVISSLLRCFECLKSIFRLSCLIILCVSKTV